MKKIVYTDPSRKLCRIIELPKHIEDFGGRVLAELLFGKKLLSTEKYEPDNNFGKLVEEPQLIIAPGLLSGFPCASAGRCVIACRCNDNSHSIKYSNAGGNVAFALAYCDIAAIVISGNVAESESQWQYLLIEKGNIRLEHFPYQGGNVTDTLAMLTKLFPNNYSKITFGRAGEHFIPMANLSFTGDKSVSHAGSGSGAILAHCGIRAIVIQNCPLQEKKHELSPAALDFAKSLVMYGNPVKRNYTESCNLCVLGHKCAETADREKGRSLFKKNKNNSLSTDLFLSDNKKFIEICDEFGVDTRAMERMLYKILSEVGFVDIHKLYCDLEPLKANAEESPFFIPMLEYTNIYKESMRKQSTQEEVEEIVLDSLGLCKYAGEALHTSMRTQETLDALLKTQGCCSLDKLISFAKEIVKL